MIRLDNHTFAEATSGRFTVLNIVTWQISDIINLRRSQACNHAESTIMVKQSMDVALSNHGQQGQCRCIETGYLPVMQRGLGQASTYMCISGMEGVASFKLTQLLKGGLLVIYPTCN